MNPYLQIFAPEAGKDRASFDLYLPADEARTYFAAYHFRYEVDPVKPSLSYEEGPNDPANRRFYRIRTAHMTVREGAGDTPCFRPLFRALQGGEIGLAYREKGAGDFVGGFHGDEVLDEVCLTVDGRDLPLDEPFCGFVGTVAFFERSTVFRCNTPSEPLFFHTQIYTVDGGRLNLAQRVEWLRDARPLQAAYMPMLTAQRLDPEDPARILTDTVEFYGEDGTFLTAFDTTPYGQDGGGKNWVTVCKGTPARAARVYGKASGFSAETGYTVKNGSIPASQQTADLCIRFMKHALDNKIYFNVGKDAEPKAGTVWESDVYYRLAYHRYEKNGGTADEE